MLDCLKFLLNLVIKFISVLFRVNVGFTSLGVVFCIVFILFPILLAIVNFIKTSFIQELDDRYDESRPRTLFSMTEYKTYDTSGRASHSYSYRKHHSQRFRGFHNSKGGWPD